MGWFFWTVLVSLGVTYWLPEGLPFVTWMEDGTFVGITWWFLICWVIAIGIFPVVLRPVDSQLFGLGWAIWTFVVPALLMLLRSGGLVTWTYELGDAAREPLLTISWGFLGYWLILFWIWPLVWRRQKFVGVLTRMGRGLANAPRRLSNSMRNNPLFFITWVVLIVGWQLVSLVAPPGALEHPLVPGWDYIFGQTLFRMAGDWQINVVDQLPWVDWNFAQLAPIPATGGERTWPAVFLALSYHSAMTMGRLLLGLALGLLLGIATGLAIPYWPALRQTAWVPMNFLRMIPLLAAIPWMQFSLGTTVLGTTLFIGFGVWVTLVVATMNSVANVPDRYIESARTLGATRLQTYFRVIVPGAMPELRTALLLSAGLGWSLSIAAEFLGFPTGLGYMASIAVQETNTARLVIVAFIVAVYSLLTFFFLNEMFKKLVSWMPQRTTGVDISRVAGVAGAARAETMQEA